jgi:hypothetical protein
METDTLGGGNGSALVCSPKQSQYLRSEGVLLDAKTPNFSTC